MARDEEGSLVAVIADEDTITGFLLAGVGDVDIRKRSNFLVVDSKTTVRNIEQAFKDFTTRDDVAIVLISQPIANMIRHIVSQHSKVSWGSYLPVFPVNLYQKHTYWQHFLILLRPYAEFSFSFMAPDLLAGCTSCTRDPQQRQPL